MVNKDQVQDISPVVCRSAAVECQGEGIQKRKKSRRLLEGRLKSPRRVGEVL